jgi:hypothetical protein
VDRGERERHEKSDCRLINKAEEYTNEEINKLKNQSKLKIIERDQEDEI